jgi:hypothetical protein
VISDTYLSRPETTGDEAKDSQFEEFYERIHSRSENEELSALDLSLTPSERMSSSIDFIELLLRFILIAVSRTYSSGDAFFVIEDLFGGEGLCLCGGTGFNAKRKNRASKKTKVKVTTEHVLVELFQQYDLYLAESIGSDESLIAPLVSFETKVFTLITLKSENTHSDSLHLWELFLLLSASPEKICHRFLTIIPSLP